MPGSASADPGMLAQRPWSYRGTRWYSARSREPSPGHTRTERGGLPSHRRLDRGTQGKVAGTVLVGGELEEVCAAGSGADHSSLPIPQRAHPCPEQRPGRPVSFCGKSVGLKQDLISVRRSRRNKGLRTSHCIVKPYKEARGRFAPRSKIVEH